MTRDPAVPQLSVSVRELLAEPLVLFGQVLDSGVRDSKPLQE